MSPTNNHSVRANSAPSIRTARDAGYGSGVFPAVAENHVSCSPIQHTHHLRPLRVPTRSLTTSTTPSSWVLVRPHASPSTVAWPPPSLRRPSAVPAMPFIRATPTDPAANSLAVSSHHPCPHAMSAHDERGPGTRTGFYFSTSTPSFVPGIGTAVPGDQRSLQEPCTRKQLFRNRHLTSGYRASHPNNHQAVPASARHSA